MIEAHALTKRYGDTEAVADLSFIVPAGQVTGFLGPNGAGKSTTMRMIVGLDAPTSGEVLVDGQRYGDFARPLRHVGALLDATAVHGGRSARDHLLWLALSNGIERRRVDVLLDQVGMTSVAKRRIGGFSLGMFQRLGIAAALLGDPDVVVFDEPVNGLDPEGVLWIRTLLQTLAGEGRTVLLSSHLMSEMAITADRLIIIGRGRLITETSVDDLLACAQGTVRIRGGQVHELTDDLIGNGAAVEAAGPDTLRVTGLTAGTVGNLAARSGIALTELVDQRPTLEDIYMELTSDAADYHSTPLQDRP